MLLHSRHAISRAFDSANTSVEAQSEIMVGKIIETSKTKIVQLDQFQRDYEQHFASHVKMHGECINAIQRSIEQVRLSVVYLSYLMITLLTTGCEGRQTFVARMPDCMYVFT